MGVSQGRRVGCTRTRTGGMAEWGVCLGTVFRMYFLRVNMLSFFLRVCVVLRYSGVLCGEVDV